VLPVFCLRRNITVLDEKKLNITTANIHTCAECFKNKVLGEPKKSVSGLNQKLSLLFVLCYMQIFLYYLLNGSS
jgi:hypothetical protein